jgi:peptidoglycan-associated lipoprotein
LVSKSGLSSKLSREEIDLLNFRLGESNRILGNYKDAQTAYERMFRRHTPDIQEVYLRYGQVLIVNEQYDKAKEQLLTYKKYESGDRVVDSLLLAIDWIKENKSATVQYTVDPVSAINTRNDDYAPAYASGDYEVLYFTSSRKGDGKKNKVYDVTGEPLSSIYSTGFTRKGSWGRPNIIDEALNAKKLENGACTFNNDYTILYFTRCGKVKREKLGCSIYTARRVDDAWNEPEKIPIADDSLTVAHPSLSSDDLALYFTSDLPGGYGGMDIWKVTRNSDSDSWGEPINMGPEINTSGNEMFPFAHADGSLYFASDGHVGFGGLDIFKATQEESVWKVQNVGQPINSSFDDCAIIFERDNNRGFFTSNRKGTAGSGVRGDDIYAFSSAEKAVEFYFSAVIKDAATNKILPAAEVRLVGSNGVTLRRKVEATGLVEFRVDKETDYLVVGSNKGYLNKLVRFSSRGWSDNYTLQDTLLLTPTDKPIEIPNIFFDFGKATLRDESRASLDSLVMIMKENPSLIFELRAHTDSRGSEDANYVMSQQRAQAVVDYLINNGVDEGRMEALGIGESQPKVVDAAIAKQYSFLRSGTRLDDRFIDSLKNEEQQEICHQLNRRIEFKVLDDNYQSL